MCSSRLKYPTQILSYFPCQPEACVLHSVINFHIGKSSWQHLQKHLEHRTSKRQNKGRLDWFEAKTNQLASGFVWETETLFTCESIISTLFSNHLVIVHKVRMKHAHTAAHLLVIMQSPHFIEAISKLVFLLLPQTEPYNFTLPSFLRPTPSPSVAHVLVS